MSQPRKIFPLRLPENFHGRPKHRPNPIQQHRIKLRERDTSNPEQLSPSKKVTTWQRKIYDRDILHERREMLVHPAKISCDMPDWCKTTTNYFHRNEYVRPRRDTREECERFDVFNRQRKISFANDKQTLFTRSRFSQPIEVTGKIGWEDRARSHTYKEVAPKVGSVQTRDLSVRKPQLKVGKSEYINTYSPF